MRNDAIRWVLAIATGFPAVGLSSRAATVTATLVPSAPSYFAGEPIGLDLTMTNPGPEAVKVEIDYPLFKYRGHMGIKLSAAADADADPFGMGPVLEQTDGKTLPMPLNAGESRSDRIYLQRYMHWLAPGTHRILYSVHIAYTLELGRPSDQTVLGRGMFEVVVLPSGETELAGALEKLAASTEAMCVADSPLAIPYLVKIGKTAPEEALRCLSKFRGNPSAEEFVLQQVRHGRESSVAWALEVLGGWHFAIAATDFEQIMNLPGFEVRSQALRYATRVRDPSYLQAIRVHFADPTPGISEQARHVEASLTEKK
jgi:hypothetical protein